MASSLTHFITSIIVAVSLGMLIDVDHTGSVKDKFKCMLNIKNKECEKVGLRGVMHNTYLWFLAFVGFTAWTLHLILDGVLP